MATKTDKPAETLTAFERFVKAIFQVPKVAIYEADAKRLKRARKPTKTSGDA
jgi:hypothetical protein